MNDARRNISEAEPQAAPQRLVQLTGKRGMSEADFTEMVEQLGERRARAIAADEEVGLYAETLAESAFAAQDFTPDCRTCGACCAYFHQVAVLDSDPTPRRLTWAVWDDGAITGPKTHWLRREALEGHCVAFSGGVGRLAHCAIYELRPASCRAFEAGSDRCRAVRRAYGLEPPLSADEQIEHARRIEPDAGGEWNRVEAFERRNPSSFGEHERAALLAEMIAYNRTRLAEISAEGQRLQLLLAEQGLTSPAETAAHHVTAINEEARAVTSALAQLPSLSLEYADARDEAGMEKLSGSLLDVAAQSQASLKRAARWLLALGELVFAAFGMRVEPVSVESTDESSEADQLAASLP